MVMYLDNDTAFDGQSDNVNYGDVYVCTQTSAHNLAKSIALNKEIMNDSTLKDHHILPKQENQEDYGSAESAEIS